MSVLTRSKPLAVAGPGAPAAAPLVVPGRLGPSRVLGAVVLGGTVASLIVTATRPKNVPPAAQKVADTTSLVVLSMHPLEAAAMRRYAKKRGVAPSTRRRATFATLVYGVFGTVPARRKIRKATG
jgi:hypothetical protein